MTAPQESNKPLRNGPRAVIGSGVWFGPLVFLNGMSVDELQKPSSVFLRMLLPRRKKPSATFLGL